MLASPRRSLLSGVVLSGLLVLSLSGPSPSSLAAHAAGKAQATKLHPFGAFEAAVYQGPDKGLALKGMLTVSLTKAGQLTGQLVRANGAPVKVSGQVLGVAINL